MEDVFRITEDIAEEIDPDSLLGIIESPHRGRSAELCEESTALCTKLVVV